MKGLVLYDTAYGNTRRVAEAIAEALKEKGHEIQLRDIEDVKRLDAAVCDFVAIGSPTKIGNMTFAMRRFLGRFKGNAWRGKPFLAFDTELVDVIEKGGASAGEKIQKALEEMGMKPLVPVFKAGVVQPKGPLAEGVFEKAREHTLEFGEKLGQPNITQNKVMSQLATSVRCCSKQ